MNKNNPNNLLEIRNLTKNYSTTKSLFSKKHKVNAVDDVSITICQNENLGLVGESGSGKSTLGKIAIRLLEPTKGDIFFEGKNLRELNDSEMRKTRKKMQIIFQDSLASLNPYKTIRKILSNPLLTYHLADNNNIEEKLKELLEKVELNPPEQYLDRFPHQLSGGERQRVCIARAISLEPNLIIADEPVSALDMSIRYKIIDLLKKLQKEQNITYLLISHDLNVTRALCDKVAVMHKGKIVEISKVNDLFEKPQHPYTKKLLASLLKSDPLECKYSDAASYLQEYPRFQTQ